MTRRRPHALDRKQTLPGDQLARNRVDDIGDVGRERFRLELPARRAGGDLASLQHRENRAKHRGLLVDELWVAGELVIDGVRQEALTPAPGCKPAQEPAAGRPQGPLDHLVEPVLAHHLGGVHCLRERQLLVRVSDAVVPPVDELLDQDCALRVHDTLLGDSEDRPLGEPAVPVPRDDVARDRIRAGVCAHVWSVRFLVEPVGIEDAGRPLRDAEREAVRRPRAFRGDAQSRPVLGLQADAADHRAAARRDKPDDGRCACPARVDGELHEADELPRARAAAANDSWPYRTPFASTYDVRTIGRYPSARRASFRRFRQAPYGSVPCAPT